MSSTSNRHKARAQYLFQSYMGLATGENTNDVIAEWDEIIEQTILAAVAEAREIYAAPPATPEVVQDDSLARIATALERIADRLDSITGEGTEIKEWKHLEREP